ncbi:MAG: fimbrial protein [Pseudoxanthomonas suwonensis]|nr:MAG: fimbrial protein [Pseudoxanthomonas suwonensis]
MSLRELDFNNAGVWPRGYKIGACILLMLIIIGLAWWLFVSDKRTELQALEQQEETLRKDFEDKQGRAANLEPLKQQLAEMEEQLKQMLRQLPSRTEMPKLINDISTTALSTGLAVRLFQPGTETPKEFYAEKPIELRMSGSYHQFGAFVSGVATLPRVVILTMHDIALKPEKEGGMIAPNQPLELAGTVKTYRYLDEDEQAEIAAAQAAANQTGGQP